MAETASGAPPWAPPLFAFIACVVSGVTSFGDGVFFLLAWALSSAAGLIRNDADTYPMAVLYVTLLPLSSLPSLLWSARKELRPAVGYAFLMSISSSALIPLGSKLLLTGDLATLKAVLGAFFLIFSVFSLWAAAYGKGVAATAAAKKAGQHRPLCFAVPSCCRKRNGVPSQKLVTVKSPLAVLDAAEGQSTSAPKGAVEGDDGMDASSPPTSDAASLKDGSGSADSKLQIVIAAPLASAVSASPDAGNVVPVIAAADATGDKIVTVVSPLRALGRPLSGVHRNSSRDSTTRPSFAARLSAVAAGRPASVSLAHPSTGGSARSLFFGSGGSSRSLLSAQAGGGVGASSRSLASARSSLISSSRSLLSAAAGASSRTLIAIAEATAAPARHLDGVDLSEDRTDAAAASGGGDDGATGIADGPDDDHGGGRAASTTKSAADAGAAAASSAVAAKVEVPANGAASPGFEASVSLVAAARGGREGEEAADTGSASGSCCCGVSCCGASCCSTCATPAARSTCLKRWFPVASDKCSPRATAITMFVTGFASGLLSGLVGSGGPPQLVAFTQLRLRKDFIRGIKVLATTVSNLIRLGLFIAWKRSLLREPWWVYASICVASILGAMVGGKLRDYLPGEAVLYLLYVLLFASCGELFGVLDTPSSIVGFSVGLLGWLGTVWVLYRWPGIMRPVARAAACFGSVCKRAACGAAARLQCSCCGRVTVRTASADTIAQAHVIVAAASQAETAAAPSAAA